MDIKIPAVHGFVTHCFQFRELSTRLVEHPFCSMPDLMLQTALAHSSQSTEHTIALSILRQSPEQLARFIPRTFLLI